MKNILLATTALVMSAGFASAEVTFSGTAEGGVTRAAPKAAVTGVAGRDAAVVAAATTVTAQTGTSDGWQYVAGVLTYVKTSGTIGAVAGDDVAIATAAVSVAQAALDAAIVAQNSNATAGQANTAALQKGLKDTINAKKADLAIAKKVLATVTGTAASVKGATNDVVAYSGYDFNIGLSAASDNGITFAAGFDMGAGQLSDIANNELDTQGTTVAAPTVSASMNGYTVSFKKDGLDDLYDNTQAGGDLGIKGSIGSITFNVVTDLEKSTAASAAKYVAADTTGAVGQTGYVRATFTDAIAAVVRSTSYSVGTTVGGVGLSVTGTDGNDLGLSAMKAKATYTMDALTFGLESNNRGDSTKALNATKVSVAYAGEGVSASVSSNDDKDWDLSATLSAGANSATFSTDEESAWDATVASDLGGGASVFGYVDHTDLFMAGVRFKF
jgi:outer membrane protein OmpU